MTRLACFVLLATVMCSLVGIRPAEGQLTYNYQNMPNGRSLNKVSTVDILPPRNMVLTFESVDEIQKCEHSQWGTQTHS